MSISTDITHIDAAKMIANGIRVEIQNSIYSELMEYITPQIKQIAAVQAEKVCKEAVIRVERNVRTDQVNVMVRFGEDVK